MIILQVNNVSKSFESTPILSNINLEVKSNEKIALVGKNGVGKSTLLKIIARELTSDSGQLIVPKHVTIGYLAQETGFESERTIWQEMIAIFAPLKKMEATLRELEVKMGDPDLLEQREKYEQVLATYDQLQNEFTEQGGYRYEADIRSVLHGLQFAEFDYEETIVSTLSGGQKTRLALAKLLLQNPDLLILDEPTNHLDIETLSWLETYLQNYAGSLLIVSHDRYFLDLIVTTVYELANGEATKYVGNYSNYLKERTKRYEQLMKEYEKQAADIANIEEFVQRNIARASTTVT